MNRIIRGVRLAAMSAPFSILMCAAGTPFPCIMSDPQSCPNTNYLAWSPGFEEAVTKFIGTGPGNYFRNGPTLTEQALYGLRGPPYPQNPASGGLYLFAACPAHDCGSQAVAIVLDNNGAIKGIGFSSYHCGEICALDRRYLDFYVKRDSATDQVVSELTK